MAVRTSPPTISHDHRLADMSPADEDPAAGREAAYSRTRVNWEGRVGLNGFQLSGGIVCARASFHIDLALEIEIIVAREVYERPCLTEVVVGHELEHAAISESNLRASADELDQELRAAYKSRDLVGSEGDLLEELNRDVEQRWKPRLWALIDEGDVRHRVLDERDKLKTRTACGGALARLLRRHGEGKQ